MRDAREVAREAVRDCHDDDTAACFLCITTAIEADRREVLEAACRAVCPMCSNPGISHLPAGLEEDGNWRHAPRPDLRGARLYCHATPVRSLLREAK